MAKNWYVNTDGDITDGEQLIAEPNYLTKESYKNAHLLAAAPELLAACELALEWFNKSPFINRASDKLEEAIAKANGEA